MSLILKFKLTEFNKEIEKKFRESEATKFFREISSEPGQSLIKNHYSNVNTRDEIIILRDEVFSLNRKVKDSIRFRVDCNKGVIDGNDKFLQEDDETIKIVIVLESPHKNEYNYSYRYYAKKPASGVTGENIKKTIYDKEFWRIIFGKKSKIIKGNAQITKEVMSNLIKNPIKNVKELRKVKDDEENFISFIRELGIPFEGNFFDTYALKEIYRYDKIDIHVVNRIGYQTSLGSYYNNKLIKPIKNNIFKMIWNIPEVEEDFYTRLFGINPNIIINASTKELDFIKKRSFEKELIQKVSLERNVSKLFYSIHPSRGIITESLKEVKFN